MPEGPVTASGHRAAAWRCGRAVRRAAPPSARASAEKPAAVSTARPPSPPSPLALRRQAPATAIGRPVRTVVPMASCGAAPLGCSRQSSAAGSARLDRGGHRHRHADNGDSDQCRYRSLLHLIHLTPPRRRRCAVRLSKRKRLPLRPIALSVTAELDPSGSRIRPFNGQCVIVCPRRDATTVRCATKTRLPVRRAAANLAKAGKGDATRARSDWIESEARSRFLYVVAFSAGNRYPPIARRKTRVNALMIKSGAGFSGKCSGAWLTLREIIAPQRTGLPP